MGGGLFNRLNYEIIPRSCSHDKVLISPVALRALDVDYYYGAIFTEFTRQNARTFRKLAGDFAKLT